MAIKFSPHFAILLLFMYLTVVIVVCMTALPQPIRWALLMLITLNLLYYWVRDALLLLPSSWCEIRFVSGDQSALIRDGSRLSFHITKQTTISPHFILLRVGFEGRRLPVARVIFPDSLATDEFRQLCVRLKFS